MSNKNNKIDYKIAINLSIKTVSNPDFIIFLEDLVSKNEDFVKHIVFSITSYSASAYKNIFHQNSLLLNFCFPLYLIHLIEKLRHIILAYFLTEFA